MASDDLTFTRFPGVKSAATILKLERISFSFSFFLTTHTTCSSVFVLWSAGFFFLLLYDFFSLALIDSFHQVSGHRGDSVVTCVLLETSLTDWTDSETSERCDAVSSYFVLSKVLFWQIRKYDQWGHRGCRTDAKYTDAALLTVPWSLSKANVVWF